MAVLTGVVGPAGLGLEVYGLGFLCVFYYLGPLCFFGVFSPVCFELSVPVQVIAWNDSSPK